MYRTSGSRSFAAAGDNADDADLFGDIPSVPGDQMFGSSSRLPRVFNDSPRPPPSSGRYAPSHQLVTPSNPDLGTANTFSNVRESGFGTPVTRRSSAGIEANSSGNGYARAFEHTAVPHNNVRGFAAHGGESMTSVCMFLFLTSRRTFLLSE